MTSTAAGSLGRRAALLRGVDPEWLQLFDFERVEDLEGVLADNTTPPHDLIFEAFRYGSPDDVRAVIIGQDAYPTPGDAQGVCFSVPRGRPIPDSLKRVFGCLERAGLRAGHATADGPDTCGDLRSWAVQGVLMLNMALTTRAGERGTHLGCWKKFADELIRRLCVRHQAAGRRLHFLLWGGPARATAPVPRRHGHVVHEWTHPSPMADNRLPPPARFRECPHFEDVNSALATAKVHPIVWDNLAPVIAFSDGSCPQNGAPDARAGFAAVIVGGPFRAAVVRGEVRPFVYALADGAAPERGLVATAEPATPTNNRAEYLGFIHCLAALLLGCAAGAVEVVSDSKLVVETMLDYLPKRLAKKTEHELKNLDLVLIAWRLLGALRGRAASVALTHTRSHRPPPPASAPARARLVHRGNAMADEHAGAVLAGTATYAVEVLSAPAVLRALAAPTA